MKLGCKMLLMLALASGLRAGFEMPVEGKANFLQSTNTQRKASDNLRSLGGEVSLYLTPLLVWEDSNWYWTAVYDMDYTNVNTLLKVDDELFNFVQRFNNLFELGGGWRSKKGHKIAYKAFVETFNGKEALDDIWWLGPYDYRDGGAKLNYTRSSVSGRDYQWNLGLKLTDRMYPNWTSLDSSARKEKDQTIAKLFFDWSMNWRKGGPFSTFLTLANQTINYKEAYIVDESGTTTTATGGALLRADNVFSFSADFLLDYTKHHWAFTLHSETRDSNFNYYDSGQNFFVADYNDYSDGGLDISYAYDFEGPWWFLDKPQLTIDLIGSTKKYKTRKAKDDKGQYTDIPQSDEIGSGKIGLNSPISEHWSLDTSFDFAHFQSNNKDQSSSIYNYQYMIFRLGTKFAY